MEPSSHLKDKFPKIVMNGPFNMLQVAGTLLKIVTFVFIRNIGFSFLFWCALYWFWHQGKDDLTSLGSIPSSVIFFKKSLKRISINSFLMFSKIHQGGHLVLGFPLVGSLLLLIQSHY